MPNILVPSASQTRTALNATRLTSSNCIASSCFFESPRQGLENVLRSPESQAVPDTNVGVGSPVFPIHADSEGSSSRSETGRPGRSCRSLTPAANRPGASPNLAHKLTSAGKATRHSKPRGHLLGARGPEPSAAEAEPAAVNLLDIDTSEPLPSESQQKPRRSVPCRTAAPPAEIPKEAPNRPPSNLPPSTPKPAASPGNWPNSARPERSAVRTTRKPTSSRTFSEISARLLQAMTDRSRSQNPMRRFSRSRDYDLDKEKGPPLNPEAASRTLVNACKIVPAHRPPSIPLNLRLLPLMANPSAWYACARPGPGCCGGQLFGHDFEVMQLALQKVAPISREKVRRLLAEEFP
jgi:hypothetical protein